MIIRIECNSELDAYDITTFVATKGYSTEIEITRVEGEEEVVEKLVVEDRKIIKERVPRIIPTNSKVIAEKKVTDLHV